MDGKNEEMVSMYNRLVEDCIHFLYYVKIYLENLYRNQLPIDLDKNNQSQVESDEATSQNIKILLNSLKDSI